MFFDIDLIVCFRVVWFYLKNFYNCNYFNSVRGCMFGNYYKKRYLGYEVNYIKVVISLKDRIVLYCRVIKRIKLKV